MYLAVEVLDDIATAKKNVLGAWTVAKIADPAAHICYASMYGVALVELQKYQEAVGPLDEVIRVAAPPYPVPLTRLQDDL